MRQQNTTEQEENKNSQMIPTPCPPPTHILVSINHPNPSHPLIICNNSTMDMALLVQMRQSDKCRSVRNDEIININLGSGLFLSCLS